jgi:hypothetical protein
MNARALTVLAVSVAVGFTLPGAASASGGDDVRSKGDCSGNSTSKIKAKTDDGRIEVEFEVDQNKNGEKWQVRLKDNGDVAFRGTATTKAPSGSFSLERRIDNLAGQDSIVGIGRNDDTGERCTAKVTI